MANEHLLPSTIPSRGDRVLVTLRAPMLVVLNEIPTPIIAIDGDVGDSDETLTVFRVRRMLKQSDVDRTDWITMRAELTIPVSNMAGIARLPKEKP